MKGPDYLKVGLAAVVAAVGIKLAPSPVASQDDVRAAMLSSDPARSSLSVPAQDGVSSSESQSLPLGTMSRADADNALTGTVSEEQLALIDRGKLDQVENLAASLSTKTGENIQGQVLWYGTNMDKVAYYLVSQDRDGSLQVWMDRNGGSGSVNFDQKGRLITTDASMIPGAANAVPRMDSTTGKMGLVVGGRCYEDGRWTYLKN